MAVQKPQKALEVNGQEIYPLTSIDQIILEDGSRLNSKLNGLVAKKAVIADNGAELYLARSGNVVQATIFWDMNETEGTISGAYTFTAWEEVKLITAEDMAGFTPVIDARENDIQLYARNSSDVPMAGMLLRVCADRGIDVINNSDTEVSGELISGTITYITEDDWPE